jgi:hypothetical protein
MAKRLIKKFWLFICGLLFSVAAIADEGKLPPEMWDAVFQNLSGKDLIAAKRTSWNFYETIQGNQKFQREIDRAEVIESWSGFADFDARFVKIPRVTLPPIFDHEGVSVLPFVISRYPVTRQIWVDIMGENSLHNKLKFNWKDCINCPITYVAWEDHWSERPAEIQTFLARLNEKTSKLGCTYDLPTDPQLWASIRGDETGENQDPYSKGVTDENLDEYVTYYGNSGTDGGRKLQPVGHKKLNAFGIELGNIWKVSKDLLVPSNPLFGRSRIGGSWKSSPEWAKSNRITFAGIGNRSDDIGFTLVRYCK